MAVMAPRENRRVPTDAPSRARVSEQCQAFDSGFSGILGRFIGILEKL